MPRNKHSAVQRLMEAMDKKSSLVCCGLDPDLRKIPLEVKQRCSAPEQAAVRFLCQIIDITGPHVCAFKAQKAFFDLLPHGHEALKEIITYAHTTHPETPVIVDCKVGDIDNTMDAYAQNIFENQKADGIVINPLMGDDVMQPMSEWREKMIVVLVKTSNAGGAAVQDLQLADGRPLWQFLLEYVVGRWNGNGNMVPVVAATHDFNPISVRALVPDATPILIAGVGAQGGSIDSLAPLLNSKKIGVFVNSSRNLLYPVGSYDSGVWETHVAEAVTQLKNLINASR